MPKFADIGFQRNSGNRLDLLTYKIPAKMQKQIKNGQLVKVPFLKGTRNGLVFSAHSNPPKFVTKDITEILETHPLLVNWQLELMKWIAEQYFCSIHTIIKQFIPQNIFLNKKERPRKIKDLDKNIQLEQISPKIATQDQQKAINAILSSNKQHFLIHGVTGAGKTEIYLRLAKSLKKNEQFVLLVPEISLTPQLIEYFRENFKEGIATIHSRLIPAQKRKIWKKIRDQEIKIVIGSRSALFAPFNNLKYIVIDEEHEWSYKQDQSPRYHARTVAEKICQLLPKCKLVLGSATPSIESYYRTADSIYHKVKVNSCNSSGNSEHPLRVKNDRNRITLLELPKRISNTALPKVQIVDLRKELQRGNYSIFSEILLEKMTEKLAKSEQILLFLNRRGAASSVLCRDCGECLKCKYCDVSLTYHRFKNNERLICHYCGIMEHVPQTCPNCQSTHIKFIGIGTQRIEQEIKKLFPGIRVLRADKDTTTKKDSFSEIYKKLKNHEVDVLIGTQMIGKGLHLPKINLVGVILADIGLHIPDFRSSEKTFQLLTQVAGRAGRIDKGEVIIQTYIPEHPAIQFAKTHNYKDFYSYEIKNRWEAGYPPFKDIIKLLISHQNKEKCKKEHQRIHKLLLNIKKRTEKYDEMVILAHPALIERIHNKYRYVITLKGKQTEEIIKEILPELAQWKIDRDPYWN